MNIKWTTRGLLASVSHQKFTQYFELIKTNDVCASASIPSSYKEGLTRTNINAMENYMEATLEDNLLQQIESEIIFGSDDNTVIGIISDKSIEKGYTKKVHHKQDEDLESIIDILEFYVNNHSMDSVMFVMDKTMIKKLKKSKNIDFDHINHYLNGIKVVFRNYMETEEGHCIVLADFKSYALSKYQVQFFWDPPFEPTRLKRTASIKRGGQPVKENMGAFVFLKGDVNNGTV